MICHTKRLPYILLVLWLTCLLIPVQTTAQHPQHQNEFSRGSFENTLWTENFYDNNKGWPEFSNDQVISKVRNGKLLLATNTDFPFVMDKETGLWSEEEFELDFRYRTVKVHNQGLWGMSFGDQFDLYALTMDKRGVVQLLNIEEEGIRILKRKATAVTWSPRELHELTFRQTAKSWEFFLDDSYLFSYPRQEDLGSRTGVFALGNLAMEVRHLKLRGIKLPSSNYGNPRIQIHTPSIQHNSPVFVENNHQRIMGEVSGAPGTREIWINGEAVHVNEQGYFFLTKKLDSTVNRMHVSLSKEKGTSAYKTFTLIKRKKQAVATVPKLTPKPRINRPAVNRPIQTGHSWNESRGSNHLLVIGVDRYYEWPTLKNAVKDVKDVTNVLLDFYDFSSARVTQILNEEATREKILETFHRYQKALGPDDNLIIYYAGHGHYEDQSGLGYWIPVDARMGKVSDYIGNSTIHDYLRTINTKHTFLIADACYAGSLFTNYRSGYFTNSKSRWAFTSGGLERVWDGKPGGNSPFAKNLIEYLLDFEGTELPINLLIEKVSRDVSYETTQNPKGSPLKMVGDAGGVMILKKIR